MATPPTLTLLTSTLGTSVGGGGWEGRVNGLKMVPSRLAMSRQSRLPRTSKQNMRQDVGVW